MHTAIERREFLRQAALAGLVVGWPWSRLGADEAPGAPASPLGIARAEMARRGAPGLVFVVPDALREPVTAQLNRLFGGTADPAPRGRGVAPAIEPKPELLGLFARAVFVCATGAEVERELGEQASSAAVVRLAPDGSVAEVVARGPELVEKPWDVVLVPRLVALLDGTQEQGLEAAATFQRRAFPAVAAQAEAALAALDAAEFDAREVASATLLDLCDRTGNGLALAARRTSSLEVRTRISGVLAAYVARLGAGPATVDSAPPPAGFGERHVVPYGVRWDQRTVDPCPSCGRGSASLPVRRYLTLVAGAGK